MQIKFWDWLGKFSVVLAVAVSLLGLYSEWEKRVPALTMSVHRNFFSMPSNPDILFKEIKPPITPQYRAEFIKTYYHMNEYVYILLENTGNKAATDIKIHIPNAKFTVVGNKAPFVEERDQEDVSIAKLLPGENTIIEAWGGSLYADRSENKMMRDIVGSYAEGRISVTEWVSIRKSTRDLFTWVSGLYCGGYVLFLLIGFIKRVNAKRHLRIE